MKNYKKTGIGSFVALLIGSSCCWISSLAIWVGGATIVGAVASISRNVQVLFLSLGFLLLIISVFSYWKMKSKSK